MAPVGIFNLPPPDLPFKIIASLRFQETLSEPTAVPGEVTNPGLGGHFGCE